MSKEEIALRKKIAEALVKARKIVATHKAEYHNIYTMGSGGGGTTTTNNTSTSSVPASVLAEYNQVTGQANQVASAPLNQYGGQIVAGTTPEEQAAYNTIDNMQGISQPYTQAAGNLLGEASQNINPETVGASQIQQYESPYTQQVLGTTMAAENNQDAQQQAQIQGNAISSGAWGGDRSGVAQGILAGQQDIANNATNAGIENQGYSQALTEANTQQQAGLGAQEASQYLQEAAGMGANQLGTSAEANTLTGASAQLSAGQLQQQQAQAELNVPYEEFLQQQAYPFQTTGWLGNIAEGIGSNEGGTTTGTSSTQQPSEGLFSDRRLKKNIKDVGILAGKHGNYPLHTFEFKGGNTRHTGVIAQEVEKKNPDAVHMDKSGYRKVDYTKLARGGIVPHRYNGGPTPLTTSINPPPSGAVSTYDGFYFDANGNGISPVGASASETAAWMAADSLSEPNGNGSSASATAAASAPGGFTAQVAPTYAQFVAENGGTSGNTSGTPYSGGAVPGLNAANQADLSSIYAPISSPATTASTGTGINVPNSFNIASMIPSAPALKRGGIVAHRDSGGNVTPLTQGIGQAANPFQQNVNSNYSQMSVQQLQQLSQRVPQATPQGQAIAAALKQKQFLPNVGSAAMKRGGIVPQHFGDDSDGGIGGAAVGSNVFDGNYSYADSPLTFNAPDTSNLSSSSNPQSDPSATTALSALSNDASDSTEAQVGAPELASQNSTVSSMPAPTPPPNAPDHPANMPDKNEAGYLTNMPTPHEPNPWLSVGAAVLGTLAGRSRNPLVDIGQGGLIGLNNYAAQTKTADEENYKQGDFTQNAQKLSNERADAQKHLALEQQQAAETSRHNRATEGQYSFQTGWGQDENGNPVSGVYALDARTGTPKFIAGMGLAGKNTTSGTAGTAGKNAPAQPNDPTTTMTNYQTALDVVERNPQMSAATPESPLINKFDPSVAGGLSEQDARALQSSSNALRADAMLNSKNIRTQREFNAITDPNIPFGGNQQNARNNLTTAASANLLMNLKPQFQNAYLAKYGNSPQAQQDADIAWNTYRQENDPVYRKQNGNVATVLDKDGKPTGINQTSFSPAVWTRYVDKGPQIAQAVRSGNYQPQKATPIPNNATWSPKYNGWVVPHGNGYGLWQP